MSAQVTGSFDYELKYSSLIDEKSAISLLKTIE